LAPPAASAAGPARRPGAVPSGWPGLLPVPKAHRSTVEKAPSRTLHKSPDRPAPLGARRQACYAVLPSVSPPSARKRPSARFLLPCPNCPHRSIRFVTRKGGIKHHHPTARSGASENKALATHWQWSNPGATPNTRPEARAGGRRRHASVGPRYSWSPALR
jgi:hypothetical protein